MKNLTPAVVVAIVCLAFSFAGLVVLTVALADLRAAFILIIAWYFGAIVILYIRRCKYFSGD
jgi:hypothetical protein